MLENWHEKGQGPRDRVLSFIHIVIANRAKIMAFGCPVGTLCSELAKLDHGAKSRAAEIFCLFRDWLAGQFRELGAEGRAEELALRVLAWSQGVAVMASAFRDVAFIRREVAGITAWLEELPGLTNHV
jgi:TetR/AcrR family transcriptional repressor of nem operon